jgi:cobyrinic acid a,c-diamide synthase
MTRGLLIAAPRSGSGKTTVTLALLAAARRQNLSIRAAKCGPDYIDPAFHAAATGHPSFNLDSWAMTPTQLRAVATAAQTQDLLIVEASMGLFDGVAAPPGRTGAGADIAATLSLPVILVLDVSGQSQTAAAVARGFIGHMPGVDIAGVILNRVASERHRHGITAAMDAIGLKIFGAIPRDETLHLPERHLGLVQALEHPDLRNFFDKMADLADRHFDLPAILRAATAPAAAAPAAAQNLLPPPGQRIALAQDAAFSFIYAHVLESWRQAGAEILPFSPLADAAPPNHADCCWLPGGYPELHAPQLAQAQTFRTGLQNFAETRPVHGECGGYMVLGETLQSADGATHAMTALLSHATSFATRKMHLGYRRATMLAATRFGPKNTILRGHEFHYAQQTTPGTDAPLADLTDAAGTFLGPAGGQRGQVTGGFFHAIAREEPR